MATRLIWVNSPRSGLGNALGLIEASDAEADAAIAAGDAQEWFGNDARMLKAITVPASGGSPSYPLSSGDSDPITILSFTAADPTIATFTVGDLAGLNGTDELILSGATGGDAASVAEVNGKQVRINKFSSTTAGLLTVNLAGMVVAGLTCIATRVFVRELERPVVEPQGEVV